MIDGPRVRMARLASFVRRAAAPVQTERVPERRIERDLWDGSRLWDKDNVKLLKRKLTETIVNMPFREKLFETAERVYRDVLSWTH